MTASDSVKLEVVNNCLQPCDTGTPWQQECSQYLLDSGMVIHFSNVPKRQRRSASIVEVRSGWWSHLIITHLTSASGINHLIPQVGTTWLTSVDRLATVTPEWDQRRLGNYTCHEPDSHTATDHLLSQGQASGTDLLLLYEIRHCPVKVSRDC